MFYNVLAILKNFVLPVFLMVEICSAIPSTDTGKLAARLGCPYCHTSLQVKPDFQNKIPNLSYAGQRYNPA